MSTLWQCDRCGTRSDINKHRWMLLTQLVRDSTHASWPGGCTLHYCPDCSEVIGKAMGTRLPKSKKRN
jgi:hypothetical protein